MSLCFENVAVVDYIGEGTKMTAQDPKLYRYACRYPIRTLCLIDPNADSSTTAAGRVACRPEVFG